MNIADKWIRFSNYLVDTIVFFLILMLHAFVLDEWLHVIPNEGSPLLGVYFFVLYFGYYFLFEYFLGRTPGKFITKTKVTDINGVKPTIKILLIRNLCRLIPFDSLTFLLGGKGWHDDISKTQVIHI